MTDITAEELERLAAEDAAGKEYLHEFDWALRSLYAAGLLIHRDTLRAEREANLALMTEAREAIKALADRDARYDGTAIVIEAAAHWQAVKLMADARATLSRLDARLAAEAEARG